MSITLIQPVNKVARSNVTTHDGNTYTTLDVSAECPAGATAVYLELILFPHSGTPDYRTFIHVRPVDLTDGGEWSDGSQFLAIGALNLGYTTMCLWVKLSAARTIQYKIFNSQGTSYTAKINVIGYQL